MVRLDQKGDSCAVLDEGSYGMDCIQLNRRQKTIEMGQNTIILLCR